MLSVTECGMRHCHRDEHCDFVLLHAAGAVARIAKDDEEALEATRRGHDQIYSRKDAVRK
jgi:predicted metal-dependent HD superfamily phosphohydrolase